MQCEMFKRNQITNFTKISNLTTYKFETCYLGFFCIIGKDILKKHPICENNTYVCFH